AIAVPIGPMPKCITRICDMAKNYSPTIRTNIPRETTRYDVECNERTGWSYTDNDGRWKWRKWGRWQSGDDHLDRFTGVPTYPITNYPGSTFKRWHWLR